MFIYDKFKMFLIGALFIAFAVSAIKCVGKGESKQILWKLLAFGVVAYFLLNPAIIFHLMNMGVSLLNDIFQGGEVLKEGQETQQAFPTSPQLNEAN